MNAEFTSKERDAESGLDFFQARYFSSAQGRFTSPDSGVDDTLSVPLPYADLQNPQSLNLYSYVANNPLRYTDPDGRDYNVCVNDENGNETCHNYSDGDYAKLYSEQNGQQGIELSGFLQSGNITCGGQVCGSVQYTEGNGDLQDETVGIGIGMLAGQAVDAVLSKVGSFIGPSASRFAARLLGRTAGEGATLLKFGGKQAAKDVIDGLSDGAQKASAKRFVAGATSKDSISISQSADGTIILTKTRPGIVDGSQTMTKAIDSAGNSRTLQTAFDNAGSLIHYDPKN